MNWPYRYSPHIWPMLATAALPVVLGVYAWRHRHVRAAGAFSMLTLCWAVWALGSALELSAVDAGTKLFWYQVQAAVKVPATTFALIFTLAYAGLERWLSRATLAALVLVCVVVFALIATNPAHHLWWSGVSFEEDVDVALGPAGLAGAGYISLLFLFESAALVWLFVRSPLHRWPATLILGAETLVRSAGMLDLLRLNPFAPLDLAMLLSNVSALGYFLALFRFRILNVLPVGRDTVMERMPNGALILDSENRVADLNPAAREMLALSQRQAIGRAAAQVLAGYPDLLVLLEGDAAIESQIVQERGGESRYLHVHASPLVDRRGIKLGRLILLQDVTEQKRARELLGQQQRMLAVIQERERLARELHDSQAQVYAFMNAQGQAARLLLAKGDVSTADAYIARLIEVAREADTDIRESILGLRVTLSERGFFSALTQYLERYEKNYGIHTELSRPATLGDGAFEPAVEAELLRIVQEALSNARKHSKAGSVRVVFGAEPGYVRVTMQDDGQGFDSGDLSADAGQRFGLSFMRERAEEVGATLTVQSERGKGTQVIVTVPLRNVPAEGEDYARSTR